MTVLTGDDVQAMRMRSLLLSPAGSAADRGLSVASIVKWFGAMQAQDLASGMWSFGSRMPGAVEADITAALERKAALRTWPMRGTVHFVPPRDAKWMVALMGARPLAGAAKRREFLGITDETATKAVDTLREVLAGGKRLTRAECVVALNDAGIATSGQASYHLLWYASQLGVTCVAPNVGKEQTFVLLDDYVPDPHAPDRDEALGMIALRYVRGHGPVTVKEIARWTGLGVRDCRLGVAAAGNALVEVDTEMGPMLATAEAAGSLRSGSAPQASSHAHLALPGFDEYMLGYGDRSLLMQQEHFAQVVPGKNGVFKSTLVRDGRVVGIWKRTLKSKVCSVEALDLRPGGMPLAASDRAAFERELEHYGTFVGKPVEVTWAA